jgi:hypothetical protein
VFPKHTQTIDIFYGLPSGINNISNFIIQWLYVTQNASQSSKTVNLPTNFSSTNYSATVTHQTSETTASNPFLRGVKIISASQIAVVSPSVSYGLTSRVIAVGY